jgi:membrane protease YdiL (CAAX protease family)
MKPVLRKIYFGFEYALLFFGIPTLLFFDDRIVHPSVILLPVLIFVILVLKYSGEFRFRELVTLKVSREGWIRTGIVVLASSALLLTGVLVFDRENLFNLPRANLLVWLLLCTFYPVFSAYTQEVLFRTFQYHRYKILFSNQWSFTFASGITFGFAHIVYYSPLSMMLTLLAGLFLSFVYYKTRSVLFTAILHGLLGIVVFTIGLGQYFWLDMLEYFP